MGLFGNSKKKKSRNNQVLVKEKSESERIASFRRASTSHVTLDQLRSKMKDIEGMLNEKDNTNKAIVAGSAKPAPNLRLRRGSCLDLTQSVLDFIPNPIDELDVSVHNTSAVGKSIANRSTFLGLKQDEVSRVSQSEEANEENYSSGSFYNGDFLNMDPAFDSFFTPSDMRCLALVSHNNMKEAMKEFVLANRNVLRKFKLTGTNTTMSMLKEVFGDDPAVEYGPACKSGPLGGDAQLVAMAVTGQVGGCIFFIDPMDAHPHSADIECLVRQGNVHNLLMLNNPTTAHVALNALRVALKMGRMEMFPSFFFDLESPSVAAYKIRQQNILQNAIDRMKRKSLIAQADKQATTIYRDISEGKTYFDDPRA